VADTREEDAGHQSENERGEAVAIRVPHVGHSAVDDRHGEHTSHCLRRDTDRERHTDSLEHHRA
jgi:hypothetical protein